METQLDCMRPIFIVGSPRSGTTLLRWIIDAHPHIMCPPCETSLFERYYTIFNGFLWERQYSKLPLNRDTLIEWFRDHFDSLFIRLHRVSHKPRICEKTPAHVKYLDLITEVYPQAKIIHIIRNGENVASSLQKVGFAPSGITGLIRNSLTWKISVEKGRGHGKKLPRENYLEIRYEDLINDPRLTLRLICEFVEEEFHKRMLEFHIPENNSWGLSLRPMAPPSSIKPEQHALNPLQRLIFHPIAGKLMRELGYYP